MRLAQPPQETVVTSGLIILALVARGVLVEAGNGKRKVISNHANSGPTTLWAVEQLIDGLMAKADWKLELPSAPGPALPKVTRYDYDPVLRTAYLESFRKGYVDAWERKEGLPVFAPTSDADKARVFGYTEGMVNGRAALAKWFGTNVPASSTH